jgi:hypothetical protein
MLIQCRSDGKLTCRVASVVGASDGGAIGSGAGPGVGGGVCLNKEE